MGLSGDFYQLVKFLHLVTVIVGFGALALTPVMVGRSRPAVGAAGAAVVNNWLAAARLAEWAVYAAGLFGVLAILVSDDVWKFSQAWISIAFVLYIGAVGVFHGMKLPAARKLAGMLEPSNAGPPEAEAVAAAERKVALASGIFNVIMVLAVVVMVWKPGV